MLPLSFLPARRLAVVSAVVSSLLSACGQNAPKSRPLTRQEAQREVARFKREFRNQYVPVTPNGSVRLTSGILVTISTAQMTNGKLHVTGNLTNTTSTSAPKGDYAFMMNQSYEEQVAHYQKVPVGLGVCAGPCITSHYEDNVQIESLPPGRSVPYTLDFNNFSKRYPDLKPSDMIFELVFYAQ